MSKRIQLDVDDVFDKVELKVGTPFLKGGAGGTNNYNDLEGLPTYEGNVIKGDLTASGLGIATVTALESVSSDVATLNTDVDTLETTVSGHTTSIANNTTALTTETTNRETADTNLQSQIDALISKSDVVDIVGTYAQLQAYDTSSLGNNDIVKVLEDSTHDNAMSYYRWSTTTQQWSYVGSEGAYYTKSESDTRFVPSTRTINNKALSSNINLTAEDVGALRDTTVIPSKTSDLTNDSGFATQTWVQQYIASLDATNTRY